MNPEEIKKRIKDISQDLKKKYPDLSKREVVLSVFAKLTEETGELADEILSSLDLQRKQKLDNYNKKKLESEWADVLIVLLLIAEALEIDYIKILENIKPPKYLKHRQ